MSSETTLDQTAASAPLQDNSVQTDETAEVKIPFRDKIPYQAILLGGFALVASTFLASGDNLTREEIAKRMEEDLLASLEQVVPSHTHENDLLGDVIKVARPNGTMATIYRGVKSGAVSSLAYEMASPAYAGPINIIMGVNHKGEILGVRVLAHAETPGLGDKIEIAKDDWITKFNGLSFDRLIPDQWKVKKDGGVFDQFSGATITPRSVVKSVKQGLDFFHANKEQLLKLDKKGTADE